jgi:sn-glycerol 3-phosphate transport system ATP-binding protein
VTVLGASGSGKSTLLRAIAGLEAVDSGRVLIDGADQAHVAPARRGVAMVFQSFALFPHLSVERNIAFGMRARREPAGAIAERVRETAAALRLDGLLERRPSELSGGEQQRVALARALAARPRLLLLDEPLSNLDAQLRQSTRTEIRRVQEETGVTTLYVTHDQGEALALGHRVAVLKEGRVEQCATPDELWERPASAWIARFVGTPPMNIVDDPVPGLEIAPGTATAAAEGDDPGGDVIIGFRAEDATCSTADADGSAIAFDFAERAGADHLWHLRAGERALVVRAAPGAAPPDRGAPVRVRVPADRVRRFDPTSGRAFPAADAAAPDPGADPRLP